VDYFENKKLKVFGPDKRAAQLESSKVFAKTFMKKYNIPTASFEIFDNFEKALKYVSLNPAVVIKADGLAAGKGVFVCDNIEECEDALKKIMVEKTFGEAGKKVVIEEKLSGAEASLLAFCDGKTIVPLIPAQDHKRINDYDKGPNTGGMGAFAPVNIVNKKDSDEIFNCFLGGISKEKLNYKGIIYVGVMLSKKGPMVLEFNVRFGDPETQAILPLLKTDLADLFYATVNSELNKHKIEWHQGYCVSVVLSSGGYPEKYETGKEIFGLGDIKDAVVFHAGTKYENNKFLTAGGRVLNVSSIDTTLKDAIEKVYNNVRKIKFEGMHYRKDIAIKGLSQ
ncbi:MAG: phosphoribosylamine--glycine ligase, partial [Elusimicrobia bacterium RIFOXYC2_FULL_34_12]